MSSRITMNAISNTVLADNQATLARLATYQEQLSSGKRVNRSSDDPVAARQGMRYASESMETDKFLSNIDKGSSILQATDSAMSAMSQAMDQVKQLAVQGANGTEDATSRKTLAQSVDSLLDQMVDLANTESDGRHLFAGTATQTVPFVKSADGSEVSYQGNLDSFAVQVGTNTNVTVNQDGFSLFKSPVDVFGSLIKLRDALNNNDPATVSTLIGTVDQAAGRINDIHGALGGSEQRLTLAQNQLESAKTTLSDLSSKALDAAFPATVSQMQLAQVALEAGLQAGAKVLKPSLLDFLAP